jgi:hypothetical protein
MVASGEAAAVADIARSAEDAEPGRAGPSECPSPEIMHGHPVSGWVWGRFQRSGCNGLSGA